MFMFLLLLMLLMLRRDGDDARTPETGLGDEDAGARGDSEEAMGSVIVEIDARGGSSSDAACEVQQ